MFGFEKKKFNFSFSTISKLLPSLQSVLLCELKLDTMDKDGGQYIKCIRKFMDNPESDNVRRITFRSEFIRGPQDAKLAALVQEHHADLARNRWSLRYELKMDEQHRILARRMENAFFKRRECSFSNGIKKYSSVSVNAVNTSSAPFSEPCMLHILLNRKFCAKRCSGFSV